MVEEGKFNEITQFKATYTIHNQPNEIVFHLLENPDGILYYQDENQKVHFYYANRDKQTVIEIEPEIHSKKERVALEAFKASFANMEMNSSRRSNDLVAISRLIEFPKANIVEFTEEDDFQDIDAHLPPSLG